MLKCRVYVLCRLRLRVVDYLFISLAMKLLRQAIVVLIAAAWCASALAQMPIPHELTWRKRSGFHIPRTRAWDEENYKYFGGGPEIEDECGGAGHCWHRPAVWRAQEYILPPEPARLTFQSELIVLKRDNEQQQNILFNDVTGEALFSMSDFNFNWQPSYRNSARYNITPRAGIEATYLRVHNDWVERRIVDAAVPIRVQMFGVSVVSPFDPFQLTYRTKMQTGELNFRRSSENGEITFITGFRWAQIDELFSTAVPSIATDLRVSTQNKLYGWQVGYEGSSWVSYGILRVDSSVKAGVYQNTARNNARLQTLGIGLVNVGTNDEVPAFLGESRITLAAPLTKHCFLRGGYQLMYLSGLAIAADQINSIKVVPPQVDLESDGQAIYHGWFLGLEAWW